MTLDGNTHFIKLNQAYNNGFIDEVTGERLVIFNDTDIVLKFGLYNSNSIIDFTGIISLTVEIAAASDAATPIITKVDSSLSTSTTDDQFSSLLASHSTITLTSTNMAKATVPYGTYYVNVYLTKSGGEVITMGAGPILVADKDTGVTDSSQLATIISTGDGDVVGPASSTDNVVVRFNGTSGKSIQTSGVTIDDSGNITTSGTVDGRDLSVDGAKLDSIESGATGDLSAGEVKTLYESNADTNAFTDSEQIKLSGIETGADVTDTANVTSSLPLTTKGDVLVHNGSSLVRVGAGANGQVLSANSAEAAGVKWVDAAGGGGGGGLIKILTTTISSSVSSVEFSLDTSTYKDFKIIIRSLQTSNTKDLDNVSGAIIIAFSEDGGSSYLTDSVYGITQQIGYNNGAAWRATYGNGFDGSGWNFAPIIGQLHNLGSTNYYTIAGKTGNAEITLFDPASTASKQIHSHASFSGDHAADIFYQHSAAHVSTTSAYNHVKISCFATYTLDAGSITLYGIEA